MKYLKKSYISEGINLYFTRFCLLLLKNKFKQNGKVLVKSCDGIGDILVRSRLAEKIIEKYGKENVYFLMKDNYISLGKILGYNTIEYSRKDRKNIFYRLKKMYELNKMGFSEYINLEFANDITVGNLFMDKRLGINDEHWQVKRNNKYYTHGFDIETTYIMDKIYEMGLNILNKNISREEFIPDLRYLFDIKEESIVVAVGSTEKSRVCSPILMGKFLKIIREKYPDKEILLVGNGNRQNEYAKRLIDILGESNIKNLVDKTTLKEVFEIVAGSFLFIGFESGLYNACFTLRKKGVILFKEKGVPFEHKVPWLNIISAKKIEEKIIDQDYSDYKINSIREDEFKEGLNFKLY